jgi:urocanate hydratase
MIANKEIRQAMRIRLDDDLPQPPPSAPDIRRAPNRGFRLSRSQTALALKNALRYVPEKHHALLIPEFFKELTERGRIYGYRYRPAEAITALPIDHYRGKCLAGRALQLMIDNNLDVDVALYPYELVTYGETGSVCQNWMQYRLVKKYLQELSDDQTLVMQSGHPLGLF